jgi:hypothetical protein
MVDLGSRKRRAGSNKRGAKSHQFHRLLTVFFRPPPNTMEAPQFHRLLGVPIVNAPNMVEVGSCTRRAGRNPQGWKPSRSHRHFHHLFIMAVLVLSVSPFLVLLGFWPWCSPSPLSTLFCSSRFLTPCWALWALPKLLSTKPGLLREAALAQTTRNARCAMRVRNRRGRPPRSKPLNTDV